MRLCRRMDAVSTAASLTPTTLPKDLFLLYRRNASSMGTHIYSIRLAQRPVWLQILRPVSRQLTSRCSPLRTTLILQHQNSLFRELIRGINVLGYEKSKPVMNRGYCSADNIKALYKEHLKYNRGSLTSMRTHRDSGYYT